MNYNSSTSFPDVIGITGTPGTGKKTIGCKLAEQINASAIIMGTHGAKGMQKVFGSFAMKVIISTGVPFMVVQENAIIKDFKNLVFSFCFTAKGFLFFLLF